MVDLSILFSLPRWNDFHCTAPACHNDILLMDIRCVLWICRSNLAELYSKDSCMYNFDWTSNSACHVNDFEETGIVFCFIGIGVHQNAVDLPQATKAY